MCRYSYFHYYLDSITWLNCLFEGIYLPLLPLPIWQKTVSRHAVTTSENSNAQGQTKRSNPTSNAATTLTEVDSRLTEPQGAFMKNLHELSPRKRHSTNNDVHLNSEASLQARQSAESRYTSPANCPLSLLSFVTDATKRRLDGQSYNATDSKPVDSNSRSSTPTALAVKSMELLHVSTSLASDRSVSHLWPFPICSAFWHRKIHSLNIFLVCSEYPIAPIWFNDDTGLPYKGGISLLSGYIKSNATTTNRYYLQIIVKKNSLIKRYIWRSFFDTVLIGIVMEGHKFSTALMMFPQLAMNCLLTNFNIPKQNSTTGATHTYNCSDWLGLDVEVPRRWFNWS